MKQLSELSIEWLKTKALYLKNCNITSFAIVWVFYICLQQ